MFKTVILSDNQPCKVRVLGLFELSDAAPKILGPYRYSMLLATGDIVEDEYIFPPKPPAKPDKPVEECEADSYEYSQWQEYNTYEAAMAHEKKRTESYENYLREISAYILENCLEEQDRGRIIKPADWDRIQQAALVPQLTEEVIADTLRDTFPGVIW